MTSDNTTIENLIDTLIELGEDAEELRFWKEIYPDLSPDFQNQIRKNLQEEVALINS